VASEGENAPETSTSRCTFACPRGGGLFAAADRSCHQMLLLKAACQWTACRGWRRTSYPLMSAKMCPRTYLVCTFPLTRCKQHAPCLRYEPPRANASSFSLFSAQCHPPEVANQPDQIPAASGSLPGVQSTLEDPLRAQRFRSLTHFLYPMTRGCKGTLCGHISASLRLSQPLWVHQLRLCRAPTL